MVQSSQSIPYKFRVRNREAQRRLHEDNMEHKWTSTERLLVGDRVPDKCFSRSSRYSIVNDRRAKALWVLAGPNGVVCAVGTRREMQTIASSFFPSPCEFCGCVSGFCDCDEDTWRAVCKDAPFEAFPDEPAPEMLDAPAWEEPSRQIDDDRAVEMFCAKRQETMEAEFPSMVISPSEGSTDVYTVANARRGSTHTVNVRRGSCDCLDFQTRGGKSSPSLPCKHLLAVCHFLEEVAS